MADKSLKCWEKSFLCLINQYNYLEYVVIYYD